MSCAVSRGDFPAWRKRWPPRLDLRRLTPEQVARIRAAPDRADPEFTRDRGVSALAREFKVSAVAAWKVRRRLTYRDLP